MNTTVVSDNMHNLKDDKKSSFSLLIPYLILPFSIVFLTICICSAILICALLVSKNIKNGTFLQSTNIKP